MLGMTPLVSMSESLLGLVMNSSMPRDSARAVLAISTSRSVRPICSRSSRNFLPADSMLFAIAPALCHLTVEHSRGLDNPLGKTWLRSPFVQSCHRGLVPSCFFCGISLSFETTSYRFRFPPSGPPLAVTGGAAEDHHNIR